MFNVSLLYRSNVPLASSMLTALMRERNWYANSNGTTALYSCCHRDTVTKTNTVSNLILSLDAQGVTSHLTFLLSVFFDPATSDAAPVIASSVDKKKGGVDKKKGAAEVQEHIAAVSASAQVIMFV